MSKLQKFNDTLNEFGEEVGKLKNVSGAYQKLQGLIDSYSEIIEQFGNNNEILNKINESQKVQQQKVTENLFELEKATEKNKTELLKLVDEKTELIRQENKMFYIELESTIRIKLDDHKSQIKHLIENERNQIKQIFENEINIQTNLLLKNQNAIKLSIWIFGGITILLSVLSIIKLWLI
jgi:Mg2+ and Co2+ transporter CorA